MRIKKSKIQEMGLDTAKDRVEKTKDLIKQTSSDFEQMGVDEPGEAAADIVSSALSNDNEMNEVVDSEHVVQYHSERSGEVPFTMNGVKWVYVNIIRADGHRDIGVYRFDHDLAYDYKWFHDTVIPQPSNDSNGLDEDMGTGEDFGDIGYRDVEAGEDDYEEYKKIMQSLGDDKGVKYDDNTGDGLPFESVRPKMTKDQLSEAVLGTKKRKVVKTFKVKDLRNE
jgi:hypothetical protein